MWDYKWNIQYTYILSTSSSCHTSPSVHLLRGNFYQHPGLQKVTNWHPVTFHLLRCKTVFHYRMQGLPNRFSRDLNAASHSCEEGSTNTQQVTAVQVGGRVVGKRMFKGQKIKCGHKVNRGLTLKHTVGTGSKLLKLGERSINWLIMLELLSYQISLEVNQNSSSDLCDEDEQEAREVLWRIKENIDFFCYNLNFLFFKNSY